MLLSSVNVLEFAEAFYIDFIIPLALQPIATIFVSRSAREAQSSWCAVGPFEIAKSTREATPTQTGWWFGCHVLFPLILGCSSSQLTKSYFSGRGGPTTNQQTTQQITTSRMYRMTASLETRTVGPEAMILSWYGSLDDQKIRTDTMVTEAFASVQLRLSWMYSV